MKKYILPTILLILTTLILILGVWLIIFLLNFHSDDVKTSNVSKLSVVILDENWANSFLQNQTTDDQQLFIEKTVTNAQEFGATAIALSGRFGETAMFRDETEQLQTNNVITKNDNFFKHFDPFDALVQSASETGLEVLLMPTDAKGNDLTAESFTHLETFTTTLSEKYSMRIFAPTMLLNDAIVSGETLENPMQTYEIFGEETVLLRDDENPTALATAVQLLAGQNVGVVFGNYSEISENLSDIELLKSYLSSDTLPKLDTAMGAKTVERTLAVTYPVKNGSTLSNSNLFLMGTSNPNAPLTINGTELPRFGKDGTWGLLVKLEFGENVYNLQNGDATLAYTVNLKKWTGGTSSSSLGGGKHEALPSGQKLVITSAIASALENAYSASTISQTLYEGAVVGVTHSLSRSASDSKIYAYQLTTGDYVRTGYGELINAETPMLSAPTITFDDEKRTSVLTFSGGRPAVYHSWEEDTLTLTFHGATLDANSALPTADWFSSVADFGDDKFSLTFTFSPEKPLYGWAVVYNAETNSTQISLKQPPVLSEDRTKPLSGVRVMLDAGHGLDDTGAMGVGGVTAPAEKDVNLALAGATQHRLEQLGATVLMTRTDDSFPTLGDRVTALNTQQPDFFISVHHNSIDLTVDVNNVKGTEAYWFYDEGEEFATKICENLCNAVPRENRGAKYGYFYVTRSNICPATLIEVGFMTNPAEYEGIVDIGNIWKEADALAMAIYDSVKAE